MNSPATKVPQSQTVMATPTEGRGEHTKRAQQAAPLHGSQNFHLRGLDAVSLLSLQASDPIERSLASAPLSLMSLSEWQGEGERTRLG